MLLSRRLAELEGFRREQERGVALRDITLDEYVETRRKLEDSAGTISPACQLADKSGRESPLRTAHARDVRLVSRSARRCTLIAARASLR